MALMIDSDTFKPYSMTNPRSECKTWGNEYALGILSAETYLNWSALST